jgi:hypothetical protein
MMQKLNLRNTAKLLVTFLVLAILAFVGGSPKYAEAATSSPGSPIIDTVAGNGILGAPGADGEWATNAQLNKPYRVAVDSQGIYISDRSNNVVREVALTTHTQFNISMTAGDIYTVAGNGVAGVTLSNPCGVTVDGSGNLYIVDEGNNQVEEVANTSGYAFESPTPMTPGQAYTVASNTLDSQYGIVFNQPYAVEFDSSGNMYIANDLEDNIVEVPVVSGTQWGKTLALYCC